jgi:hypothetical protein
MSSNWMHGLCATALGTKGWWPPYLCMVFLVSLLLMNKNQAHFFCIDEVSCIQFTIWKCLWAWCDWWWQTLWFCEQKRGRYIVTIGTWEILYLVRSRSSLYPSKDLSNCYRITIRV